MGTGIAFKVAERRADVVQEAVEQLQRNGKDPSHEFDVQQLVGEMIAFENSMRRVTATLRDGVQSDTDAHSFAAAQMVGYLLNRVAGLFPHVRLLLADAVRHQQRIDDMDQFEAAEAAITRLRKDFFAQWPMPDESRVRTAKEQVAAGQYRVH